MKYITRTIPIFKYTFANIDVETGNAMNMTTVNTPIPMKNREIQQYCIDHNDCILIRRDRVEERFTIPIEDFINSCKEYAQRVNEGLLKETKLDYIGNAEEE